MTLLEFGKTSSKTTPAPSQQGKVQIPRAPSIHCWQTSIRIRGQYCRSRRALGPSKSGHGPIGSSRFGESPPPTTEAHHAGSSLRRDGTLYSGAACVALAAVVAVSPPSAVAALHAEPANALSLPTWAIHISRSAHATKHAYPAFCPAYLYASCYCVLRQTLDGHPPLKQLKEGHTILMAVLHGRLLFFQDQCHSEVVRNRLNLQTCSVIQHCGVGHGHAAVLEIRRRNRQGSAHSNAFLLKDALIL